MRDESSTRLYIPALRPLYDALAPLAWPLARFIVGVLLMPHGWGKLFEGKVVQTAQGFAKMGLEPALGLAYYIGVLEFFGGLMIAVGFLTRFWAAQVAGFMATAVVVAHWGNGFFWTKGGYEYPLMWGVLALAIVFRGAGPLSIDRAVGREL